MPQQTSRKISEWALMTAPAAEVYIPATSGSTTYRMTKPVFTGGVYDIRLKGAVAGDVSAAATNTTALAAALADAVAAGGGVVFIPAGTFYFSVGTTPSVVCQVSGVSNVAFRGAGAGLTTLALTVGANATLFNVVSSSSKVSFEGMTMEGAKASNSSGYGVTGSASSYIWLTGCIVQNFKNDGVRFTNCSHVHASGNEFTTNDGQGLTGDSLSHFVFANNVATGNGFHGIGGIGILTYGAITGNECSGNGTVSPFADNITGYNAGNHHVTVVGNALSGGGNNGMHFGGSDLTIANNIVDTPLQYGIVVSNHDGSVSLGNSITGNTVKGAPQSGFWLSKVEDSSFSGNTARSNTSHGFFFDACINIGGSANVAKSNGNAGARFSGCSLMDMAFTARANGTAGLHTSTTSGSKFSVAAFSNVGSGIYCPSTTSTLFYGCKCSGNANPFSEDTGADSNTITGGDFVGNTSDTPIIVGALTQWRANRNGGTATAASAAALAVPAYTDFISVSGTTNITSITGNNWRDRTIKLVFAGALTVTDGSNLSLAGNFVTTAGDTLVLLGDGTFWNELSRSVN